MATNEGKPTKNMTLRLEPELAAQVEALAEIEDLHVAEVIRLALSSHIGRRKLDPDFRVKLTQQLARLSEIEEMFAIDSIEDESQQDPGSKLI